MRYRVGVLLILFSSLELFAQKELDMPISSVSSKLTFDQVVDSLNRLSSFQFSYDASIVGNPSKLYQVSGSYSIRNWLDDTFSSDSTEWIFVDNQIVGRRRRIAQSNTQRYIFSGTITSEKGNLPIPFATISIPGTPYGTVSNGDGKFRFTVKSKVDTCNLIFSSLGYWAKIVCFTKSDSLIHVKLKESVVDLPEVTVEMIDPNRIMQKVSEQRFANYPQISMQLTGFFREAISLEEKYVDVLEASVLVSKPSYGNDYQTEKVLVEKVRRYNTVLSDGAVNLKLQGGPFYFAKLDVARNADFLPSTFSGVNPYKYFFEGYATDFDRKVFVVSFKPIIASEEILYQGTFYIDTESFAITRVKFRLTDGAIKRSRSFFVQHENKTSRTVPQGASYEVNYRFTPFGWILAYATGELELKITRKGKWRSTKYKATTELSITDGEMSRYNLIKSGYVKSKDILSEHAESASPLFWENTNSIPPLNEVRVLFNDK